MKILGNILVRRISKKYFSFFNKNMNELEALFNSKVRPKVLKLFFQNADQVFTSKKVSERCQILSRVAAVELEKLRKINLLLRKTNKRKHSYSLNLKFSFLNELRVIIDKSPFLSIKELNLLLKKVGRIKLVVVCGILLKDSRSPADLLIVADKIQKSKIARIVKKIESNVGKEIRWSLMTMKEFNYRTEIHDRFLKDIFSYSFKEIIGKLNLPQIKDRARQSIKHKEDAEIK